MAISSRTRASASGFSTSLMMFQMAACGALARSAHASPRMSDAWAQVRSNES